MAPLIQPFGQTVRREIEQRPAAHHQLVLLTPVDLGVEPTPIVVALFPFDEPPLDGNRRSVERARDQRIPACLRLSLSQVAPQRNRQLCGSSHADRQSLVGVGLGEQISRLARLRDRLCGEVAGGNGIALQSDTLGEERVCFFVDGMERLRNLHSQLIPRRGLIADLANLSASQLDSQQIDRLLFAKTGRADDRATKPRHGPGDVELSAVRRRATARDCVAVDLDTRGKHAAIEASDVRVLSFGPFRQQAFRVDLKFHDTHASPRTMNGVSMKFSPRNRLPERPRHESLSRLSSQRMGRSLLVPKWLFKQCSHG